MKNKQDNPVSKKGTIIITVIQTVILALIAFGSGILTDNRADTRQSMIETGAFQRQEAVVWYTVTAEYKNTAYAIYQKTLYPEIITPSMTPPLMITPLPSQTGNDPEGTIYQYYNNLYLNDYSQAWNILTEGFRLDVLNNDYSSYVSFWSESEPITIVNIVKEYQTQYKSSFLVSLYFYSDQKERIYHYILIYDQLAETWKIDSVLPLI